jgi:acetylornithine deacetylase/succinyl-diaminopimelate desuccinylase-like protein
VNDVRRQRLILSGTEAVSHWARPLAYSTRAMSTKTILRPFAAFVFVAALAPCVRAQEIDWSKTASEAVDTLRQYIRFNTTVPPGDVTGAAAFLQGILEREGVEVTRYVSAPGKVILVSRLKGSGSGAKPILLLNHMDVVPADASRWDVDPFGGDLKDGFIWGRGAMDMKGTGTLQLYAFLTLARQKVALDRDIIFMAVPDEEIGGTDGARYMLREHYAELDPEYVLDEGGFGSREIYVDGKLVFGISVEEKQIVWLDATAEGVAGHGSQPNDQNPNDMLVRALARVLDQPFPVASNPVLDGLHRDLGTLQKNKFTNAIQNTTVSLTSLRSGVGDPPKVNVIPSIAKATLDARLLPGTDADEWLAEVKSRLGDQVQVKVAYQSEEPVVTPHDTPLFRALAAAIKRHHPDATVVPTAIPYGTDSNAFRHRGTKSYGILPVVLPASIVASMHSDSERLPVDQIESGIRIFYEALTEVAAK